MIRNLKHLAVASLVALTAAPALASGGMDQDTVIDARGNAVYDSNGGCVRTRWEANVDGCGAMPMAESPAPAQRQISREDRTVYFDFNKAKLTEQAAGKLDSLARASSGQVVRANVIGYADKIGGDDYNQTLSEKRAAVVAKYLAAKGLDTRVMDVRALGETASAESCQDVTKREELVKCLWRDRRVEVELEYYSNWSQR